MDTDDDFMSNVSSEEEDMMPDDSDNDLSGDDGMSWVRFYCFS